MFKVPQPKYDVGDVVYLAATEAYQKGEECPDCLGSQEWHVVLPSGDEFEIPCSTCSDGFCHATGRISHQEYLAYATKATVATVRIDTGHTENPVSYMATETGYPSGSVLYESWMFSTEEEALSKANEMAAQQRGYIEQQRVEQAEAQKKKTRYKPSWEKRRIRELEKQVKSLTKQEK